MVSKSISARMAPFVWKYLERLQQKNDTFATCAGVLRIQSEASGSGVDFPCDRFVIAFPYGAQCCKWEVIFDLNKPEEPPDFIFLNNDQNFSPDYEELKSLHNWDHGNPDSLVVCLNELLSLYKLHHKKQIEGTRVEFELSSLTRCEENPVPSKTDGSGGGGGAGGEGGTGSCQIFPDSEVFVGRKSSGDIGPILVTVKLPVDFSALSEVYPNESCMDKILSIVTYENVDGGNVTTQVYPSSRVDRILRIMGGIPHVPFPLEGCLQDYVASVTDQIGELVDRFSKSFRKRRQFVQCLTSAFSSHLLEFDAVSYGRVHLLVSTETSSTLLLTVEVPQNFPAVQPTLQFASVCREGTFKVVKDFPYSPRWSAEEMTNRLKLFLLESVSVLSKDLSRNNNNNNKSKTTPVKN